MVASRCCSMSSNWCFSADDVACSDNRRLLRLAAAIDTGRFAILVGLFGHHGRLTHALTLFGITEEAFIVFAANAFALLGLRALYFLLADLTKGLGGFEALRIPSLLLLLIVGGQSLE